MNTQEEIKTPVNLCNELDYKDGDIVAKDVLSNDSGSVTLLAFDSNAVIARHSVNCDVLVTVIEGAVEFEVDDQRHKLEKCNSIILPANTHHTVTALDRSKVVLIKLKA